MVLTAPHSVRTFIDGLLDEQRGLSAVEQFSKWQGDQDKGSGLVELVSRYRRLLPTSMPAPGNQYAFEVDLDKCSGCKACVTACHSLNGLDEEEIWRSVGRLIGELNTPPVSQGRLAGQVDQEAQAAACTSTAGILHVTTACHHCVDPGCLNGCPVLAYDKDPVTGIVRHLDDQCIGCHYCEMKCPYEVPKYSHRLGIVRKCDMCEVRLAGGEPPACVQGCPNEAIRIVVVKQQAVIQEFRGTEDELSDARSHMGARHQKSNKWTDLTRWLPAAPEPSLTLPSTRYIGRHLTPSFRLNQEVPAEPQPPHWPLILMLVLTQAGIGGLLLGKVYGTKPLFAVLASSALVWGGVGASVLHLGRPRKAWKAWLGWRTSWLSREVIALNVLGMLVALEAIGIWIPAIHHADMLDLLLAMVAVVAVAAQAMVYADTRREFWRLGHTAPRFFGTVLIVGLAVQLTATGFSPAGMASMEMRMLAGALAVSVLAKLGCEAAVLVNAIPREGGARPQLRRTAVLQLGPLWGVLAVRTGLGLIGGVLLPLAIVSGVNSSAMAAASLLLCLFGEFAERYLFFTSVSPDKMPA